MQRAHLFMVTILAALAVSSGASATSGFGCYTVNVGPNDPLKVRLEPRADSPVVATLSWRDQPIVAFDALPRGENTQSSLFDVHMAEFAHCGPDNLPLGARWCPVALYGDGEAQHGWVKRRFLDHSECP
ncbi:hypothetical protein RDV64_22180 [Acuticoccus sp. MNP-M23]|uniref:hypothetical protein n=1 Tax=Acuticoccus sp. MNP-M23 TaxID=3072793 RepID=UPI00281537BD|nr:hypothetical protein [Acuticoccus sp. MNP-M23]WMS42729.1 hypothetical protein RDV64_22180 [Acuticoccus sp. MNP-M23]